MIRRVTHADIDDIVSMLDSLHSESPVYGRYTRDEHYVRAYLSSMISTPSTILLTEPGKGVMFGCISSPWFSPIMEAHEMLLYVREEYRGGLTAVKLIKEFECVAMNMDAQVVIVGSSTGINDPRTEALYEKLGYERLGNGLEKRLY